VLLGSYLRKGELKAALQVSHLSQVTAHDRRAHKHCYPGHSTSRRRWSCGECRLGAISSAGCSWTSARRTVWRRPPTC
jgi:hypothetical protein